MSNIYAKAGAYLGKLINIVSSLGANPCGALCGVSCYPTIFNKYKTRPEFTDSDKRSSLLSESSSGDEKVLGD